MSLKFNLQGWKNFQDTVDNVNLKTACRSQENRVRLDPCRVIFFAVKIYKPSRLKQICLILCFPPSLRFLLLTYSGLLLRVKRTHTHTYKMLNITELELVVEQKGCSFHGEGKARRKCFRSHGIQYCNGVVKKP